MIFFFWVVMKQIKNKNLVTWHLDIFESCSKDMWSLLQVQVSLPRWSIFLFLDVPTLKLKIIIILPTDRPKLIPRLPVQQKIMLPSPKTAYFTNKANLRYVLVIYSLISPVHDLNASHINHLVLPKPIWASAFEAYFRGLFFLVSSITYC